MSAKVRGRVHTLPGLEKREPFDRLRAGSGAHGCIYEIMFHVEHYLNAGPRQMPPGSWGIMTLQRLGPQDIDVTGARAII